jgi:hypothetical protein
MPSLWLWWVFGIRVFLGRGDDSLEATPLSYIAGDIPVAKLSNAPR